LRLNSATVTAFRHDDNQHSPGPLSSYQGNPTIL
jgi:hypothetical protein